jgi:hypothetical protein
VQSKREIRPALDYVNWEVRWPASIGDDPEAIIGGCRPYRLVVRFDTNRGKSTNVMTTGPVPWEPSRRGGAAWRYCLLPRGSSGGYSSGTQVLVSLTTASDA